MLVGGVATLVAAHGSAAGAQVPFAVLAPRATSPNSTRPTAGCIGSTSPSPQTSSVPRSSSANSNWKTIRLANPVAVSTNAAEEAPCLLG